MTLASKDIENERALFGGCPAGHLTDLTYPEVDRGERLLTLHCRSSISTIADVQFDIRFQREVASVRRHIRDGELRTGRSKAVAADASASLHERLKLIARQRSAEQIVLVPASRLNRAISLGLQAISFCSFQCGENNFEMHRA